MYIRDVVHSVVRHVIKPEEILCVREIRSDFFYYFVIFLRCATDFRHDKLIAYARDTDDIIIIIYAWHLSVVLLAHTRAVYAHSNISI